MKKKNFTALSKQIDVLLEKFSQKNSISNSLFEREVAEHKANSVSWGGYQELQYIQDFNKKIYTDVEEVINGIQSLITEINRKLNSKQLNMIEEKLSKHISAVVSNYKKSFKNAMGAINRTNEISLDLTLGNLLDEVHYKFSLFQFKKKFTRDQALCLSIIGNIISVISVLMSIILNYFG